MEHPVWKASGPHFVRSPRPMTTCPTCEDLNFRSESGTSRIKRVELFDLAESADEGDCKWCALIYRAMLELGAQLPTNFNAAAYCKISSVENEPIYVEWTTNHPRIAGEIYSTGNASQVFGIRNRPALPTDIKLAAVLDQIRSWLRDCEQNHPSCPKGPVPAPRQLIDIGLSASPLNEKSLIQLKEDPEERVQYIALSHCWGTKQAFTTKRETLSQRLKSISWKDVPKTYQDAMIVARELGIRYLWIDSLCIIQDCTEDWNTEAVKMGDIYENSYLTLAAALSSGDECGFLDYDQARGTYYSFPVDLADHGIPADSISVRNIHDVRTLKRDQILSTRAWTLQENLTPQRLLTFSVTVTFDCRKDSVCECGNSPYADPFCGNTRDFEIVDRVSYRWHLEQEYNDHVIYEYWNRAIVEEYTRRALTKPKDRLPALAALEMKFAMRLDDTNHAGLWRANLPSALYWESVFISRHIPGRAPSWSWASVEGCIFFETNLPNNPRVFERTLRVIDVQVHQAGDGLTGILHVYGQVCSAWLEAKWLMSYQSNSHNGCQVALFRDGFPREDVVVRSGGSDVGPSIHFDSPVEAAISLNEDGSPYPTMRRTSENALDNRSIPVSGNVYCLLLSQQQVRGTGTVRRFLVLGRHSYDPNRFQRIGTMGYQEVSTSAERPIGE